MSSTYQLNDSITSVKGVGDSTAEKLLRLRVETVSDLIKHFPSRYLDFTQPVKINELQVGKMECFSGSIGSVKSFFSNSGKLVIQATVTDETGRVILTWFNNPFIKKIIKENTVYTIAGKVSFWGKSLTVVAPTIEEGDKPSINSSGLVPIYPQTEGINSRWIRTKLHYLLPVTDIDDPVSQNITDSLELIKLSYAYQNIHFPKSKSDRWQADKRLSFNEHLRINLNNQLELQNLGDSVSINISKTITKKTTEKITFKLTLDQERTVTSIYKDLTSKEFTHRLIQGDTGSGKTATIIFAANQCIENGLSCAILAPTEILATQHHDTFKKLSLFPERVQLITGSTVKKPSFDKPSIFIGTHSLLTKLPKTLMHPLVFVAIDEQHKFGVNQRNELIDRTPVPHLLNLSATPIPRTVALGLLGDISISNIFHKPKNRIPTKTYVVSPSHFKKSPDWITKQLENGSQIFVVCPNIEDHQAGVASVEKIAKIYKKIVMDNYPVTTLHGKMSPLQQTETISNFKKQSSGILVATSLIEVGLDIPSANIMIIHSAERFGLASLHQLRGRVGRGEGQGYCFLVPTTDDEEESERLQLLQKFKSGLILAQKDLRLRGAGEVFGIKQHGVLKTRLKYFWSKKLFIRAKQYAKKMVKESPHNAKQIASKLQTC